jgi:hypothetical protein
MTHINKMIAAEGGSSSSKDELELLVSAQYTGRLAQAIIDKLYHNHSLLFNSLIHAHPKYPGEYSFGLIERAFAEFHITQTRLNKGLPRYFVASTDTVYKTKGVDLYLSREWYAITRGKPRVNPNHAAINDLIRILNNQFHGNFVYVETDDKMHELWGPSGTL